MSLSFKNMMKAVDLVVKSGHVPAIVGLQGIGKSDLVRTLCAEKGYGFTEITCSLLQEGDLAMPFVATEADGSKNVQYAINRVIMDANNDPVDRVHILFLDEFNRPSSPQVQSELMNLVLQRRIVDYDLNNNVRIVIAMNPSSEMEGYEESNYAVSLSDAAIMGRVVMLNMYPILSDWSEYGKDIISNVILTFLSNNPDQFYTKEVEGRLNNTPRGWSRASDLIKTYEASSLDDISILKDMLQGTLEKNTVVKLIAFYRNFAKSVDYAAIANEVLNANNFQDWPDMVFKLNDAGLDKVFTIMLSSVNGVHISDVCERNLIKFIISVDPAVTYSWIMRIEKENLELYMKLTENNDFAEHALKMVSGIKRSYGNGISKK